MNWSEMSDQEFRLAAREFLDRNCPRDLRHNPFRPSWKIVKEWAAILAEAGWSAPNWPVEHGGMGLTSNQLLILYDEQESLGIPRLPDHGIVQLGLLVIRHGTDEQRKRLLPRMRTFQDIWGQCYSEPNAGSDLASLSTSAVIDGDDFVINGRKIWTSWGEDATHFYLLARTDKNAPRKQAGISFLLVDRSDPGITVRPIPNIAGATEFAEILFENVRTPVTNIVGKLHDGWRMATGVLSFERLNGGSPRRSQSALGWLERVAAELDILDDPVFADRFAQLQMDVEDLRDMFTHFAAAVSRGEQPGPDISALKLFSTETFQRVNDLALEVAGDSGIFPVSKNPKTSLEGILARFLVARSSTIGAGTSEIQRNILAKNVLGLPD